MTETVIVLAIRIFLGLVFFPSALGKLINRSQFNKAVLEYEVLPSFIARLYAFCLPLVELTLGIMLFAGIAVRLVTPIVCLLLITFIVAIIINLKRKRILKCHCYGAWNNNAITWGTVIRNIVILILTIFLFALASNNWGFDWQHDVILLSSLDSLLIFSLMIFSCFIMLHLIEQVLSL